MREITFAVYRPPKEGLPYLAVIIAPNGDVAAAATVCLSDWRCDNGRAA